MTPCEIALYVSLDGRATWKGPLTKVQGSVGKNIASGEHTITWQVLEEWEELASDNIQFKVASIGKKPFEPEMALVEGDAFMMGSEVSESTFNTWGKNLRPEETPQHLVKVSSFYLSKCEVTQAQWQAVMGTNPSLFKNCPQCPVENVSFDEVLKFITKLNTLADKNYRLPTESEWEFAYRGGVHMSKVHSSALNDSILLITDAEELYDISVNELDELKKHFNALVEIPNEKNGWFSANSESKTHKVGLKSANILGLFDLGGNVAEWCSDWHSSYEDGISINPIGPEKGDKRVVRGGSFADKQIACRYASRKGFMPAAKSNKIGFRLAQSADPELDPLHENTLHNQEFAINPIWSYLKVQNLTTKSEQEFLKVYSNPDSCKVLWDFAVANELTDLNQMEFSELFLPREINLSEHARQFARLKFFEGMTLYHLGAKGDALNCMNKGLESDDSCAQLYFGRGIINHDGSGQTLDEITADFYRANQINKYYIDPLMEIADALRFFGKRDEALSYYSKVIDINPKHTFARERRAMINGFYGNDYKSAISDITKCLEYSNDSDKKGYYYEKRAHYKSNSRDYRGAIEDLSAAISLKQMCSYYQSRAEAKYEIKDFEGAITDYTNAINCYPDYDPAYFGRAWAKCELEDYSGAVQDFTKAIEMDEGGYAVAKNYFGRGCAYLDWSKYSLAINDFNKVIQVEPGWSNAYYNRGQARVLGGLKEPGCNDFRKAGDLGHKDAYDAIRKYCQ